MRRRWQNKIAESSATLPTACVVVTLLWWLPQGSYSTDYLAGWVLCALTTYVIIELAAQNALIRIRSRMVSSLYLQLMAVCGSLHPLQPATVMQFCLATALFCLLRTCEKQRPELDTFHAFLLLSLGSLLWAPLLLLAPVLLWNQGVYLRSLSWKSLGAAVCGLLLPYAFWATALFALGDMAPLVTFFTDGVQAMTAIGSSRYTALLGALSAPDPLNALGSLFTVHPEVLSTLAPLCSLCLLGLLGLTGFVHYIRQSYDDKTRVRMCHYSFLSLQLVLTLWLLVQPHFLAQLFPLLLLACVPAAAHFIALTRTWVTNAWVILLTLLLLATGVCTLALPGLQFSTFNF